MIYKYKKTNYKNLRSLSHDSLQSNLFWIDGIKKIIIIMSEHSKHMRTLVQCEDPKALTYVHSKVSVFFIELSPVNKINQHYLYL